MGILNYTTTISTEKTASEIQKKLVEAGAQAILCEYDSEAVMYAMSFRIATPQGVVSFLLPASTLGGLTALKTDSKVPNRLKTKEQAARVAWRILKDWIEAQLAIIEAGMVDLTEVFLPYAQRSDGKTVYQIMQDEGLKMLTHGEK